jgi:hypothetical protein
MGAAVKIWLKFTMRTENSVRSEGLPSRVSGETVFGAVFCGRSCGNDTSRLDEGIAYWEKFKRKKE